MSALHAIETAAPREEKVADVMSPLSPLGLGASNTASLLSTEGAASSADLGRGGGHSIAPLPALQQPPQYMVDRVAGDDALPQLSQRDLGRRDLTALLRRQQQLRQDLAATQRRAVLASFIAAFGVHDAGRVVAGDATAAGSSTATPVGRGDPGDTTNGWRAFDGALTGSTPSVPTGPTSNSHAHQTATPVPRSPSKAGKAQAAVAPTPASLSPSAVGSGVGAAAGTSTGDGTGFRLRATSLWGETADRERSDDIRREARLLVTQIRAAAAPEALRPAPTAAPRGVGLLLAQWEELVDLRVRNDGVEFALRRLYDDLEGLKQLEAIVMRQRNGDASQQQQQQQSSSAHMMRPLFASRAEDSAAAVGPGGVPTRHARVVTPVTPSDSTTTGDATSPLVPPGAAPTS